MIVITRDTYMFFTSHLDLLWLCTQPQMPGCWCFNKAAGLQLLLQIIYIQGYNQAWPRASSYIFYKNNNLSLTTCTVNL